MLEVIKHKSGQLVVDSRLIAEELNINHKDWLNNIIKKYQSKTEQAFGQLCFQNTTVINSVGAKNEVKFVYLTEDQSLFYMTLSRNTEEVVNCKLQLVQKFSQAKKLLSGINTIEQLELANSLAEKVECRFKSESIGKQFSMRIFAHTLPQYADLLEEAKIELAKENAIASNELYTPTNISKILISRGLKDYTSANKVNKLLNQFGLQTKPKKNWIPTAKARQLDLCKELEVIASLDQKANSWCGKQLRWKESVIDYIVDNI